MDAWRWAATGNGWRTYFLQSHAVLGDAAFHGRSEGAAGASACHHESRSSLSYRDAGEPGRPALRQVFAEWLEEHNPAYRLVFPDDWRRPEGYKDYIRSRLALSPVIRRRLEQKADWFSPHLQEVLK
jgi:hypothetical protein